MVDSGGSGAGGEGAECGGGAWSQGVDAVQLVLEVVQARVLHVEGGAGGILDVYVRAIVVDADLLLASEVEVVMQMARVGPIASEQELRSNYCWAHELWQQVACVLVVLEGTRGVLALGLEVLGFPEDATYHPPI